MSSQPRFRTVTELPDQAAAALSDPGFDDYYVVASFPVAFQNGERIYTLLELKCHRPRGRGKRGVD